MAKKTDSKKITTKEKKAGTAMNMQLVKLVLGLFDDVTELTKKVSDAGDPNTYAEGVNNLNQGVSDTYEQMRNIIVNSDEYSDDEKLEKLQKLAESEAIAKKNCSEMIMENRKNVAKVVMDVFGGLLTCGLYFVPAIIKRMKGAMLENPDIPQKELEDLQSGIDVDAIAGEESK